MDKIRVVLIGGHLPPSWRPRGVYAVGLREGGPPLFRSSVRFFYDSKPANVGESWHREFDGIVHVVRSPLKLREVWKKLGPVGIKQSHINPTQEIEQLKADVSIQVIHNLHVMRGMKSWDKVVCVSRWVRNRQLCSINASVIYNGVDEKLFDRWPTEDQKRRAREKLGIPHHAFVVGRVGFITSVKRVEKFLSVAGRLLAANKKLYCLSVGGLPKWADFNAKRYLGQIDRLRQMISCKDRLIWDVDGKFGEDLVDVYHAMDVFLQQSKFETFSRATAEAMMCGVVPIVGAASGMTELVGTHGFTVAGDVNKTVLAVEKLLSDRSLYDSMRSWGRKRAVELFTAERQFLEFEKLWLGLSRSKGLLGPHVSIYEQKQVLSSDALSKRVMVVAPTNGEHDFSHYLTVEAEALGLKRFEVMTYRSSSSMSLGVRQKEFAAARSRVASRLSQKHFDLVVCLKMMAWTPEQIQELRDVDSDTEFVHWMTDITAEGAEQSWLLPILKVMDHAFMTGRGIVQRYKGLGIDAHWATEGFCRKYFRPRAGGEPSDIVFVGGVEALGGYPEGLTMGLQYPHRGDLVRMLKVYAGHRSLQFQMWGSNDWMGVRGSGSIWNEEFSKMVTAAKVVVAPCGFSTPFWREPFYSSNRLYLYLGCEAFVLCEYFEGLEDHFVLNHRRCQPIPRLSLSRHDFNLIM